jgi:hypothetical protein
MTYICSRIILVICRLGRVLRRVLVRIGRRILVRRVLWRVLWRVLRRVLRGILWRVVRRVLVWVVVLRSVSVPVTACEIGKKMKKEKGERSKIIDEHTMTSMRSVCSTTCLCTMTSLWIVVLLLLWGWVPIRIIRVGWRGVVGVGMLLVVCVGIVLCWLWVSLRWLWVCLCRLWVSLRWLRVSLRRFRCV